MGTPCTIARDGIPRPCMEEAVVPPMEGKANGWLGGTEFGAFGRWRGGA